MMIETSALREYLNLHPFSNQNDPIKDEYDAKAQTIKRLSQPSLIRALTKCCAKSLTLKNCLQVQEQSEDFHKVQQQRCFITNL